MRSHACMVDPSTCDAQVLFFGGKPLTRVQEQVIWCRNEGDRVNFRTWIYFNYLSFEIHSLRLVDVPASEHTNVNNFECVVSLCKHAQCTDHGEHAAIIFLQCAVLIRLTCRPQNITITF
jgi:hypothetical protein